MSKFENYKVTRLFTDIVSGGQATPTHVLDLAGGSSLSEIFIIDDSFNLAARGQGQLKATLAEGDYLVKYRTGDKLLERWVKLDRDIRLEPSEAPLPPTAAPISEQTGWSQAEYNFAEDLRRQFSFSVFVRDEFLKHEPPHPDNVSVLDHAGNPIAYMKEPSGGWHCNTAGKVVGFGGMLPPGGYMLMVSIPGLRPYAMAFWIAPHCSTQVFMDRLQLGSKGNRLRGPHLASASIFITNTHEPWDLIKPLLELNETAKSVLRYDRPMVPTEQDINRALDDKLGCPSFALFAAHLLRLRYVEQKNNTDPNAKSTAEFLQVVVEKLDRLLPGSPDLGALQFAVGRPSSAQFPVPPMLSHSWAILQELGATTIPNGSYADRIRPAIAATRPWLIFDKSKVRERTDPQPHQFELFGANKDVTEKVFAFQVPASKVSIIKLIQPKADTDESSSHHRLEAPRHLYRKASTWKKPIRIGGMKFRYKGLSWRAAAKAAAKKAAAKKAATKKAAAEKSAAEK